MLFKDTQSKVWWESWHCQEAARLVDRRSRATVKGQFAASVEKKYEAVKAMIEGQLSAGAYNFPVLLNPAQVTITFSTQLPDIGYLQLLDEFIDHYVPAQNTSYEVPLQWLQSITSMICEPRAPTLAISTHGLGWARHVDHRNRCIENGLENYVAAVGDLQKDISSTSIEQILSTISFVTLFELYDFGSEFSRGWVTHLNGIQEDFQNFGPHCSCERFQKSQADMAYGSWVDGAAWINQEKSLFQRFIELAAEATGLIEHGRALETARLGDIEDLPFDKAADHLMSRLLGSLLFTTDADQMFRASQMRIRLRGYAKKSSCSFGMDFDRLQAARLLHIYWTVLLELYMDLLENAVLRSRLGTPSLPGGTAADSSNMVEPLPEVAMRE
ncbi:putative Transcription factor domain-containing protein [Seiridium unicorne]|uniref:Transcription factor domain-containing protein n=1 Tax=Seiridium unicorne TaxID=138068 RepID=A0ABR2UJ86_9PEZI